MLGIELEQTRVYQEAKAEDETIGLAQGLQQERALVVRLLTKKLGNITPKIQSQVNDLAIDRVESLGEALLDFTTITDLEAWLSQN
jgi:predicted transposase YdaD